MKVVLVVCARNESPYLKQWIDYYILQGFSKIVYYDNNDACDDSALIILKPYINEGKVDYVDYKGKPYDQLSFYREAANNYRLNYDWIAFLDIDEFLEISGLSINKFLSLKKFNKFDGIRLNWKTFTDNNFIHDEQLNKYKSVCSPRSKDSLRCKTLTRCRCITLGNLDKIGAHGIESPSLNYCDAAGNPCSQFGTMLKTVNWTDAFIRHYKFRSLESFCNKIKNFIGRDNPHVIQLLDEYFLDNDKTKEKISYLNEFLKINKLTYRL